MRRRFVRLLVAGAVVFLAMQLVPYGRDHTNPRVTADVPWPSAAAASVARTSCYDCHSNETVWPWYSNVAPMSWLVQRDVENGRAQLNLSRWPVVDVDDMQDVVEDGEMPPRQYLLAHPAARLTAAEKATLLRALESLEERSDD